VQRGEARGERTAGAAWMQAPQLAVDRHGNPATNPSGDQPGRGAEGAIGQRGLRSGQAHLGAEPPERLLGLLEVRGGCIGEPGEWVRAGDHRHCVARFLDVIGPRARARQHDGRRPQAGLPEIGDQVIEPRSGQEGAIHHQQQPIHRLGQMGREGPRSGDAAHGGSQAILRAGDQAGLRIDGPPQVDDAGHRPVTCALRRRRPPGPPPGRRDPRARPRCAPGPA
jgi:hypothetical protein